MIHPSFPQPQNRVRGSTLRRQALALCLGSTSIFLGVASVRAQYTPDNANFLRDCFNFNFYKSVGSNANNAYYAFDQSYNQTGRYAEFWTGAEMCEMAIDAYENTGSDADRTKMIQLLDGFDYHHTTQRGDGSTDWSWNDYNDDISWAVLAQVRGYLNTGLTRFRDRAQTNWNLMYARGWDAQIYGGIWWKRQKDTDKNMPTNGPAGLGAFLLYKAFSDAAGNATTAADYKQKAINIYNWEKSALWQSSNGQIYDSIATDGSRNTNTFTYSQGTFLATASFISTLSGYSNEA